MESELGDDQSRNSTESSDDEFDGELVIQKSSVSLSSKLIKKDKKKDKKNTKSSKDKKRNKKSSRADESD